MSHVPDPVNKNMLTSPMFSKGLKHCWSVKHQIGANFFNFTSTQFPGGVFVFLSDTTAFINKNVPR